MLWAIIKYASVGLGSIGIALVVLYLWILKTEETFFHKPPPKKKKFIYGKTVDIS